MAWLKYRDLKGEVANLIPDVNKSYLKVKEASVTITTAQLLALNATPIEVIAAPGAGYFIDFLGATIWYDYNSAAYAGIAAGENLVFRQTDGSGAVVSSEVETVGLLDATADVIVKCAALSDVSVGSYVIADNKKIVIHLLSGEVTTGNSPLKIKIQYRIMPRTW